MLSLWDLGKVCDLFTDYIVQRLISLHKACDHPVLLSNALNEADMDEEAEQEMRIK